MMHRFKKVPGSGDEEYFNKKSPVNVSVDRRAHLAEPFPAFEGGDEYQPSPWSCPIGWLLLPIPVISGCSSTARLRHRTTTQIAEHPQTPQIVRASSAAPRRCSNRTKSRSPD